MADPPVFVIRDRKGAAHDPREVAEYLDRVGDQTGGLAAEDLHDAADVVRGLCAVATGATMVPTNRTTPTQFALFERECLRLQDLWGLTGWDLRITHEELEDGNVAEQRCYGRQRRLGVVLAKTWNSDVFQPTDAEVVASARHEMIHCLLEPLDNLAYCRFATQVEVQAASHEVLHRLDRILPR